MRENRSLGVPTWFDTNWPLHLQNFARRLKFRIQEEEELYYPCSENKGADQLCSYCTADLRLCFRIGKNPVFPRRGSYDDNRQEQKSHITKIVAFRVYIQSNTNLPVKSQKKVRSLKNQI